MLRDVVARFLESVTEREFDGPLLALLAAQGFTDIHFIHGGFEFGKDVIAKRSRPDGQLRQYAIQSKAGDIHLSAWRGIRPQIEECEYNTRAHPHFDSMLPRVATLVTTGTLKGGAAVDAQEFGQQAASRGLADFEVWDAQTLNDWLCHSPELGLTGSSRSDALLGIVSSIKSGIVSEPGIERYTRDWLEGAGAASFPVAAIEAAVIASELRAQQRLDLASYTALHLLRAAWAREPLMTASLAGEAPQGVRTSMRLFEGYAIELLDQAEPLLADPMEMARDLADDMAIVTYPAACLRLVEILGLVSLLPSQDNPELRQRAQSAVVRLVQKHPGCARPPGDLFAPGVVSAALAVAVEDRRSGVQYVRKVAEWVLDRHDPDVAGLGLASADEPMSRMAERLLGGVLEDVTTDRRASSYLATVVLDLLLVLEANELYDGVLANADALRIVPTITMADESRAHWRRGGDDVAPQPRVVFRPSTTGAVPIHHERRFPVPAGHALLLGASCRSRHDIGAWKDLLDGGTPGSK